MRYSCEWLRWCCEWLLDQEQPDEVVGILNFLGVDAYRGGTQLNVVESDNGDDDHVLSHLTNLDKFVTHYPHEARYIVDHVVYLPVNKSVPFHELNRICHALSVAMASTGNNNEYLHSRHRTNVRLKSKLWYFCFLALKYVQLFLLDFVSKLLLRLHCDASLAVALCAEF